ncbi:hypothetical protein Val02_40450 [Virgisporangium aliadipatigenens]|uniref:DUF3566 domain-containing protein n=1 Tax=Virgisporangium aliadipatigenens TaxID=741659 RepID=A0A8J3YKL2_9ACTN|nr:DUF3566 domain-containing protein [Virgisporangium aliadipatigenens]GIJ47159.1 hypothetical protein Val02_40450 [Virgisporangium aliadipatigenens]
MTETQASANARAAEAAGSANPQGADSDPSAPASGPPRPAGSDGSARGSARPPSAAPVSGAAAGRAAPGAATGRAVVGRVTVPGSGSGAGGYNPPPAHSPSSQSDSGETTGSAPKFQRAPGITPPDLAKPTDLPSTPPSGQPHAGGPSAGRGGQDGLSTTGTFAAIARLGRPAARGAASVSSSSATGTVQGPVDGPTGAIPGSARVTEAVRAARATVSSAAGRGPRRARLHIKRIDPWSTMKFSFAVSLVLFFVAVVATSVLYLALDAMGVFDQVNQALAEMIGSTGGNADNSFRITAKGVVGGSALIGAVNVVLFTALATLGAFIYNVCADLVGGIELTLAEKD